MVFDSWGGGTNICYMNRTFCWQILIALSLWSVRVLHNHMGSHHPTPHAVLHLPPQILLEACLFIPVCINLNCRTASRRVDLFFRLKITYKPMPKFVLFFFRVCNIKLTHSHVDYFLYVWDFAPGFRIGVTLLSESVYFNTQ